MCPLEEVHAVFISNENKTVGRKVIETADIGVDIVLMVFIMVVSCVMQIPIWKQKSSKGGQPVIWVWRSHDKKNEGNKVNISCYNV